MNILYVLIVLIIIGVILYLIERLLPMDAGIKLIIRAVVIIAVLLWLLSLFVPGMNWNTG